MVDLTDPVGEIATKAAASMIAELFKRACEGIKAAKDWLEGVNREYDLFGIAARRYVNRLEERYNSIKILGMSSPLPLRDVYVKVNILDKITARHRASVEDLEVFFDRDKRSFGRVRETSEGLKVIDARQKSIVLGKPGAGKTTFLKSLALQALDDRFTDRRIPIFISLKDWSDSSQELFDFIVEQFDICGFPDAQEFVRHLLEWGSCLLLLDAFDEVTGDVNRTVTQIKNFSEKYSKNHFVLSCRIAAYNYVFEKFTEVEMADFDDDQINIFVNNWFRKNSKKASLCSRRLNEAGNRPIRELAAIPLLLTMLCLVFDEAMDFPRNRAELYKEATDALLKKWDSSRSIKRDEVYRQLSPRRKEDMLSLIAYRTFAEGQYFIHQRQLEKYIVDYMQNLPDVRENSLEVDSEAVLKAMEAQHGLFVERAKGIYSFSHLTFQEYFAARYIGDQRAGDSLQAIVNQHFLEDSWREVWLLVTSMLSSADSLLLAMRTRISSFATDEEFITLLRGIQEIVDSNSSFPTHIMRILALVLVLDRLLGYIGIGTYYFSCNAQEPDWGDGGRYNFQYAPRKILHALAPYLFSDPNTDADLLDETLLDPEQPIMFHTTALARSPSLAPALAPAFATTIYGIPALICTRDSINRIVDYLRGCELLVQCLKTECYVSKYTRLHLLESLLVEPSSP